MHPNKWRKKKSRKKLQMNDPLLVAAASLSYFKQLS